MAKKNNFSISILPLQKSTKLSISLLQQKIILELSILLLQNLRKINQFVADTNNFRVFILPLQNPQNQSVWVTENNFRTFNFAVTKIYEIINQFEHK